MLMNRETMLSKSPLDLILMLSLSELHVPQANGPQGLLCLKYKKHIFTKKPLANTLPEVARIDARDRIVSVGYMRRYAGGSCQVAIEGEGDRVCSGPRIDRECEYPFHFPICPLLLILDGKDHEALIHHSP